MRTIVINSQKGGSGKTTLCAALSVEAAKTQKVCLVDTDPQGSLSMWHKRRAAENPARIDEPLAELPAHLAALAADGVAYTFIDTAPSITNETAVIMKLADLVIIPVEPSPVDLWASRSTVDLAISLGKRFVFVLNKVNTQARLSAQTVAVLSQSGAVSDVPVSTRTAYAAAFTNGLTAPELDSKGKAAKEITALWKSIESFVTETMPREVAHA